MFICLRGDGLIETQRLTAGFLLIFAALFAMVTQAQAATLISNTGQSTHAHGRANVGSSGDFHFSQAQKFTTGDNEYGYTLSRVVAVLEYSVWDMSPRVSIYTENGSGKPGSSLYTLSNPGTFGTGDTIFTAPRNATLEKETRYFVVFEETSAGYTLTGTGSNNEDSGGASGWNIANSPHTRKRNSGQWSVGTIFANKIKIHGTVNGPPNNPATGAPTISGTAQVGRTLAALTSNISDDDGLSNVSYSYRWIRVDGGTDTNISGATSSTYSPAAADAGKKVKVKVRFTDDASNSEKLTSDAYPSGGTIKAANTAPVFADDSMTLSFAETEGNARIKTAGEVGMAGTATDVDNDSLTYTLEGMDKDKFTIVPLTGQIMTKVGEGYDYETNMNYSVIVKADDGKGGTDTIDVIIYVEDMDDMSELRGNPEQAQTEEKVRCAVSDVTDDQSLEGFVECAAESVAASDTFEKTLRLLDEFRDDEGNWNDGSTYLVLLTGRGGVYFHADDREVEDLDWSGILSCEGGGSVLNSRDGCFMEYDGASSGYAHPFSASHVPLAHGEDEFVLLGGFDETPEGEPLTGVIGGPSTEAGEVDTDRELREFVEDAGRALGEAVENPEIDPAQLRGILRREGPWREGDVYIYIMDETGRVIFDGADRSREQKDESAKQYVRDLIAEAGEEIVEYTEGVLLRRGYAVSVEVPLNAEEEDIRVYFLGSGYRVEEQPGGSGNGGGGCAVGGSGNGGAFGLFLAALTLLLTVSLKRHIVAILSFGTLSAQPWWAFPFLSSLSLMFSSIRPMLGLLFLKPENSSGVESPRFVWGKIPCSSPVFPMSIRYSAVVS